jgi:Cu(I)/Ag(I) efflux system membrane fusion protein
MKARIPDLTLVAVALAAALAAGCRATPATAGDDQTGHDQTSEGAARAGAAGDEIAHYTCSMHPSVRNAEPGACPICSMYLMPVSRRDLESGEIVLDAGRRQQIGVTTAHVELRPLHASVRAVGTVTYDQSRLTDVTIRAGGWIDELYADRLGQRVKEGETLFTLFSPDLFEAQQAYLDAAEELEKARMLGSPLSAGLALEMRRRRLRLSDLGPDQLKALDKRRLPVELVPILSPASGHVIEKNVVAGAAVEPGVTLYRIADLGRVWVEAEVYESELGLLAVGDAATVTLAHLPGRSFTGRIAFVYPWLDGATRTGRVRIELANPGLALKPQMYAEVVFEPALGERLAVPEEAILYAGDRRYVFVDLGDGRLRPQAVTLGQRAGDWVEVLDGLEEGDVAVTSGNFLIAAEARLKLALDHWSPEAVAHAGDGDHAAPAVVDDPAAHAGHGDHAAPVVADDPAAHAGHGDHAAPAVADDPAAHAGHGDHAAPAVADDPAAHAGHGDHAAPAVADDPAAHAGHGDHTAPAVADDPAAHAGHGDHAGHAAHPEPPR